MQELGIALDLCQIFHTAIDVFKAIVSGFRHPALLCRECAEKNEEQAAFRIFQRIRLRRPIISIWQAR